MRRLVNVLDVAEDKPRVAHTPTPWNIAGAVHIYGLDGNVCSMSEPRVTSAVCYTPAELGSEEALANAAFIVKAVNLHDELVHALEDYLGLIRSDYESRDGSIGGGMGDEYQRLLELMEKAK